MKLVVIGGVAGGATAAARARRLNEEAQIVLFERGPYISFANCGLPYYIGEIIKERDSLLVTTEKMFSDRYRVDIRSRSEVTAIDRENKTVSVKNLSDGETYTEPYDRIILAPGAEPIRPPLPGFDLDRIFQLRNIPDTDRIKAYVDQNKPGSAVIVGGGFIGLEMAENLVHRGVKTTIVEKMPHVMPSLDEEMAGLLQAHLTEKGVECVTNDGIAAFSEKEGILSVTTESGREIQCDLVILSVGVRPDTKLANAAGLKIGETGGIWVDPTMRTSDPDIYAVGDAVEIHDFITGGKTLVPLAGPANKQARIAADNVMGRKSVYRGALGSMVVKVFDLVAASTGCTEKKLQNMKMPYRKSITHSGSHAGYYPGSQMMAIKLMFSPGSGKLLGAQIVGAEGVDKRIDVMAAALHGNMSVFDLEELELAYAPPYSSAKDPVNIAGYVAANLLKGDMDAVCWDEICECDPNTEVLLDLRNSDELEEVGRIEGALHIPLAKLRDRLDELDPDKRYVPFCAVGLRGYVGHRILTQHGFDSRNLSGGYKTYSHAGKKNTSGNKAHKA